MKTIGLIGGMSWESTATYYRVLNQTIQHILGGFHSAKCILYSVDFAEIEKRQSTGNWAECAEIMTDAAQALERAGADFIVICTNTMHKVVPEMRKSIHIPILHVAEMTALELQAAGITHAGLLGTKYTMQQDFYTQALLENGITAIVPCEADMQVVNSIIFDELCVGILSSVSRTALVRIISDLAARGAQGIILGCTEIGLLVSQADTDVPLFDTTLIHAKRAAHAAICESATR